MKRAPYTECRLYIDGIFDLQEGQYLVTAAARGIGSAYFVTHIRPSPSRPHRRNLRCIRWPVAEIPDGATVYELRWYPRRRRKQIAS